MTGRDQIAPVPREGRLPCSYQQEGLWLLHQFNPDSPEYNRSFAIGISGELDIKALQSALTTLVARHESLRTRFDDEEGLPFQVIGAAPPLWPLPVARLAAGQKLADWIRTEASRPFDLQAGPMFRSAVVSVAPGEHVLSLVLHHIVADGWSVAVLAGELSQVYDAARAGARAALPELPVQPGDHAAWQRLRSADGELDRQIDDWCAALDGMQEVEFPADRLRPPEPAGGEALLTRRLPDDLAEAVRELARTEQVSLLAVLLAGFLVLLNRYTGQQNLAVGSVFSGRTRPELESLVGYFANVVVLRTSVAGDPVFRELVRRCEDTIADAAARQDVPFGLVVEALKPERVPGRNPLVQIGFSLEPAANAEAEFRFGGTRVERLDTGWNAVPFDLAVSITDNPDKTMDLAVRYSTELFGPDRIERLTEHFQVIIAQLPAGLDVRISECEIVPAAERGRLLTEWNPVPVPRGGLLHEFVVRQAAQAPDRVAVRFDGADLSYGELNERSSRLAGVLAGEFSVAVGRVAGVLLERGPGLAIAQLAVVKTGAAWLPLDPQHPPKRIAYLTEDADVPVVITTSDLAGLLPAGLARLCLDDPATAARLTRGPAVTPAAKIRPDDIAYVMYTSGSTGTPKGVMISHQAAAQYALSAAELFSITSSDRLSQVANPCFDMSIFDFYAAFAAGATVIGAPRDTVLNPAALGAWLRDERVTVCYVPAALLSLVDPGLPGDLRAVLVAGEPCPAGLAERWSRLGTEFHNGYGPTEATATCVDYLCPAGPPASPPAGPPASPPAGPLGSLPAGPPPIGRPMANHRAYVLDSRLRLTPIGIPGQLYMAGAGLARGYLGRPDLTAGKFLPDPYSPAPGSRMYATGDLVRWRDDGNLEYLGRVDRQVKIRGQRIELGEIEHTLASNQAVRQAAVIVKDPGTPQARLAGYAVPQPGHDLDPDQLREWLAGQLPPYMVPTAIMILANLPLTSNGKTDHARLPDPAARPEGGYTPPNTRTQRQLIDIWHELLDTDANQIGIHDSFPLKGGNSLQAIQLITRIKESFGITLHPREVTAETSLAELAALIDQAARA